MDALPHRKGNQKGPFMLVVTPTRELANQIADTCMPIGKRTSHYVGTFVGGVSYDPQIRKLERGLDVAIATPGRLIDLMDRGAADLSEVEVLVLDEADRMLDMGFWPQVERIVKATPETRQTMLFSATIDRSQDQTMFSILNDPAIVEISQRGEVADKIDQYVIHTTRREKPELLNSLIKEKGGTRVIVFTRTKGGADNCTRRLRRIGIPAAAIHADRTQAQRSRALEDFRNGRINVIVATDVLARGIDVTEVDYVVNYDLPIMPEDYVHRIGRTGRAGESGFAVSLVTPDTRNLLRSVQKFIGQKIETMEFKPTSSGFEPVDGADPRMVAAAMAEIEAKHAGKDHKGSSKPETAGKKKKKPRDRDLDRSSEHKRRLEAEATGIEYVPAPRKISNAPKKRTLAERQAAAEAAFNAMFDIPNIPGDKRGEGKSDDKRAKKAGKEPFATKGKNRDQRAEKDGKSKGKDKGKGSDKKFKKPGRGQNTFSYEAFVPKKKKTLVIDEGFSFKSDKPRKRKDNDKFGKQGGRNDYVTAETSSNRSFKGGRKRFDGEGSFSNRSDKKRGKGGFQTSPSRSLAPRGKDKGKADRTAKSEFRPGRSNRTSGFSGKQKGKPKAKRGGKR